MTISPCDKLDMIKPLRDHLKEFILEIGKIFLS